MLLEASTKDTSSPPSGWRRLNLKRANGISFEHPLLFWLGILTTVTGVVLQLPMYIMARMDHFRLVHMPMTWYMWVGMSFLFIGVTLTIVGVFPRQTERSKAMSKIKVGALDETRISKTHVALLLVLAAAITIDVMKTTTLAFIAPGAALEYGLRGPLHPTAAALPIALYPLAGISGTTIGSFIWGWLGDRIGRRASILISAVIFIATSTCGTMPEYWMNLITCFFMGIGVGGMFPITFALMSETIPKRHRGWIMVLVGSDIAGAYIVTSWLASTIASPAQFGWRMLWLVGLPTGILLLLLNRWIPESPRFLLQRGRDEEATAVMNRYGAAVVVESANDVDLTVERTLDKGFRQLFSGPFLGLTAAIVLLAFSVGVTQYGFQQWMPSNLQKLGFSAVKSTQILRNAALIGFPLMLPVALLYGWWSTKKTVLLTITLMAGALVAFATLGDKVVGNERLLYILLIIPVSGISILNSVLAAYTAEVFPTVVRARGSGLSAGATKFGGWLILMLVVVAVAAPSVRMTAIYGMIPMAIAILVLIKFGPETRHKQLERITAEELHVVPEMASARA